MSEQYKFNNPAGLYFVTLTIVDWIDLFTRPDYKIELINDLQYCQKEKGLAIHAWVLMTSHLHMIISEHTQITKGGVAGIMRDFKKHTSKKFTNMIIEGNESRKEWLLERFELAGRRQSRIKYYKVWQDGNHPEELESINLSCRKWTIYTLTLWQR